MSLSESETATEQQTPVRRQRAWSLFLLTALALHIPLFIYPICRLGAWFELPWYLTAMILLPLATSLLVTRLYMRGRQDRFALMYRKAADYWLGLSPILLMTLLVFEVAVLLDLMTAPKAASLTIMITAILGAFGVVMATSPFVKTVRLSSPKLSKPLRFVQITDVHIGSRSQRFLEDVLFRVSELEPDFVCITGDFIDQAGVPESTLISLRALTCPVYYSTGNHERYEDFEDILMRLRNLGVHVLRGERTAFSAAVDVIGIDDKDDENQVRHGLAGINIDPAKYTVLLYHRPRGLAAAAEKGIDLMLSGHTHNGQIFPFNLVVNRVFELNVGLFQEGATHLYVSQGTGTWGPVLRLGTRSEITEFVIQPTA